MEDTRKILDSGSRRQFGSGAVRDIASGKGRMDLLPLDVIAELSARIGHESACGTPFNRIILFNQMDLFMSHKNTAYIYFLLWSFITTYYGGSLESAILDLAIQYEEGAMKYAERNWEKGIPCHCYVDSAIRHALKLLRGDADEPHDRAFMWNLCGLLWTLKHKPEFDDIQL